MNMKRKGAMLLSLAAGAVSMIGMGATAHAQYRDSCPDTIHHDQREVDRAVDRYGYDSREAQHERDELQRDAAICGYDQSGSRYNNQYYQGERDRDDWRNRNNNGYVDPDRRADRDDRYQQAINNGYRDGLKLGQQDARKGKSYRPQKHDEYEDADHGYNRNYGDKNDYKNQYRQAYQNGYSDGYYGRGR